MAAFLFEYAHLHFRIIEVQREEHATFSRDANEIRQRIGRQGANKEIAIEAAAKLMRWIIQHIRKHDKEMVTYVKECTALRQRYSN